MARIKWTKQDVINKFREAMTPQEPKVSLAAQIEQLRGITKAPEVTSPEVV